ncbi:hypothetical protein PPROV_000886200 [Pycnococcus provasolii]|uniref:Uncharacterized protein n=1 Tax=Pycnococcus provasolii TaxID=41880 RepID=A0A830HWH4_9CHLO|nr:hypothetical protein PPROV_000886200 [Pycnococcus provasolii]
MATMRYPVGLRKEAASYQWRTDLCGCCGYRNPLTGEMAALTFFPYALICPCCVLGANASLLQKEEPLYQSAADNACLRALCAYTCKTGVRGTAVCCCACPCCVPVACVLARYQRLQIAAKYNLPVGNACWEGCCLAPCSLTQHYVFLRDLRARRDANIAPPALPPPGHAAPGAHEADLRLAAMEAELEQRTPEVSLREQAAAVTPGEESVGLHKAKTAPAGGAVLDSSFEIAFTGAADPQELRQLESEIEAEAPVQQEEEAAAAAAAEADADAEAQAARELEEAEAMADALGDGDGDGEPADSGTPVAPLTRGNLAKHRFRDAGMDVMEVLPPTGDSAPHEPTALEKVVTEATEMAKMLEEPDGAVE